VVDGLDLAPEVAAALDHAGTGGRQVDLREPRLVQQGEARQKPLDLRP
jgi:hypothetical protein